MYYFVRNKFKESYSSTVKKITTQILTHYYARTYRNWFIKESDKGTRLGLLINLMRYCCIIQYDVALI